MKANPPIVIAGLVAVAAGGFFVGRISSSSDGKTDVAESSVQERLRNGERMTSNSGEENSRQREARESGKTLLMAEKLQRMEAIMRGENPLDRSRALLALIDQLGPGDFEAVVAQFRALGITQNRLGEYSMLLSAWAKADPLGALEYAKENTQGGFASSTILATWANLDADAALRWAEANHDGKGANPYLAGVIRGIAETDTAWATELLKGMPFGDQRGEALAGMMQHVLKQGPEASRSWITAIEDEQLRNGAMMRMSTAMADVDPKGTADWLVKNPGEASNRRLDDVYERWAGKDQDAALASINALPAGDQRTNALSGIVSGTASKDPQGALALLDRYQGDVNDGVVRDFVRNAFDKDPAVAMGAIARMTNEGDRNRTYERALEGWLRNDAPKAEAWMSGNAVPPNVVQNIRRRLERQQ
jgi:hypothetical protein